jgi:hypothetical protein
VPQGERSFAVLKGQERVEEVLELIRSRKASLISLTPQKSSLEDLFIKEVQQQDQEPPSDILERGGMDEAPR